MANAQRLSRRTFVAWVGGASAGFYLFGRLPGMSAPVALAAIPGGSLDPTVGSEVPDTAAHPAGDAEGRHDRSAGSDGRLLRDLDEAVLAADPARSATRDDGLGLRCREVGEPERLAPPQRAVAHDRSAGEPAGAGEVDQRPRGCGRDYLPHLLPVDPTLHWANPPGGNKDRDTRPTFTETPGPYTGPVPIVTHVHGAVGVADDSDGYAEAWYLPAAKNIPPGYATERHLVPLLRGQGRRVLRRRLGARLRRLPVPEREPGLDDLVPRPRARHDAPQRLRRPGGLLHRPRRARRRRRRAGLAIRRRRPCCQAPHRAADEFPPNKTYYEIPIAIQDRAFNSDGSLFYPDSREFFDGPPQTIRASSRTPICRRSGIPSSSGTRSWSTATRGRS